MRLKRIELSREEPKRTSPWWWRIPVIATTLAAIFATVVIGQVSRAASGMPEFGQILSAATNGLEEYFKFLMDVLEVIW